MQTATDKREQVTAKKHLQTLYTIRIHNEKSGLCIKRPMSFQEGIDLMQEGDVLTVETYFDREYKYDVKTAMDEIVSKHPNRKDMEVNWCLELYDDLYRLRVFYGVEVPFLDNECCGDNYNGDWRYD